MVFSRLISSSLVVIVLALFAQRKNVQRIQNSIAKCLHYAVIMHAHAVANHVADFILLLLKQEQGKLMDALFGK